MKKNGKKNGNKENKSEIKNGIRTRTETQRKARTKTINSRELALVVMYLLIVLVASVEVAFLQKELSEVKETYIFDKHSCHDYFYDQEDLVIMDVVEFEEYCKDVMDMGVEK